MHHMWTYYVLLYLYTCIYIIIICRYNEEVGLCMTPTTYLGIQGANGSYMHYLYCVPTRT